MSAQPKLLFLLPYPLHSAPSQRFRVELYFHLLKENNIHFDTHCFINETTWRILYKPGNVFAKLTGILRGFFSRFLLVLFSIHKYDYVFIHREASPVGPPVFEFIIGKIWRKKIIYDFDDAIWISDPSGTNKLSSWLKAYWKVKHICSWSYKVSAGNQFLADYAKQNKAREVDILPTCVDTANAHNRLKNQFSEEIVIGWTGSHSTMIYLEDLLPVLSSLATNNAVKIVIISNRQPGFILPNLKFIQWNELTEVEDLLLLNIGLMPLKPDLWSEGKCGFKIIQYMALGIPAVASPVGVNKKIIDEGINGFLCSTDEEWLSALKQLIMQPSLRAGMGEAGRKKIESSYSVEANSGTFLSLFS
jgi:glycosyltransferase involved in cell wall biosynthesis